MSNVVKFPDQGAGPRPANLYYCWNCEWEEFHVWHDGTVMCSRCSEEMPTLKAVQK